MSVLVTIGLGGFAFTLSAGADIAAVSGSAFGASGTVRVDDFDSSTPPDPSVLEPTPVVTLPSSGGHVTASAPSISFGPAGAYLTTGLLTVSSQGTTGPSGSSSTTASVDAVDAMGYLTAPTSAARARPPRPACRRGRRSPTAGSSWTRTPRSP